MSPMSKKESIAQLGQGVSGASRPAEVTIPTQTPRDIGHGSAQSAVLEAPLEAPVQQHEMHPTCSVAESECQRGDRSLKEDVLFLVPMSSHTRMAHSTTSNLPSLGDFIEDGHKTQSKSTSENKPITSEDTLDPSFKRLADYLIQRFRDIKTEGSNGWIEIADALKNVDEEKIGNCKEDIDTLLVFAGLFSAVLTTFVSQSYQSLSPDLNVQVVQLLTQIAVQTSGYTVSSSHANATMSVTSTAPQSFHPSLSTILVNKLWFASLVLSLIAASFGILIKQWLREYRSVDSHYSNLRSRLRVRQFRYPALKKWMVFELAALLPLMIQLALGLFFIGLCVFTWSFDFGIGHWNTGLVSAWIFFLIATTVSPVFASDCPYKISLLSPRLPSLRSGINATWLLRRLYLGPTTESPCRAWLELIALRTSLRVLRLAIDLAKLLGPAPNHNFAAFLARLSVPFSSAAWRRPFRRALFNIADNDAGRTRKVPLEEGIVASNNQNDLALLSTVDNILLDDELLSVTMRDVITRSQFNPCDTMLFIRNVLAHRLPQESAEYLLGEKPYVVDLRLLPSRVWDAVLHLMHGALRDHPPSNDNAPQVSLSWINEVLVILLSRGIGTEAVNHGFPATISQYNLTTLPNFAHGAFAGTRYLDAMSYTRTFFNPGGFNELSFLTQILRGQTTFDPHFRLQDDFLFSSFSEYRRAMKTGSATDEDSIFVEDVLNSVHDLLFLRWTTQRVDAIYHEEAAEAFGVVSLWASHSPSTRITFTKKLFLWLEIAPWESIKDMLVSSELASTTLPWILFSCGPRDVTIKNASALRVVLFALISIDNLLEPTINHRILPYMVYTFVLHLCRTSSPSLQQYPDEWSTVLLLLHMINSRHERFGTPAIVSIFMEHPYENPLSDSPREVPDRIIPLDLIPEGMPDFLENANRVNSAWSRMNGAGRTFLEPEIRDSFHGTPISRTYFPSMRVMEHFMDRVRALYRVPTLVREDTRAINAIIAKFDLPAHLREERTARA